VYEAKATARFSHPHIVTVFGVGEHMGRPYIVLEYLPGGTLRDMIAEGPLSVNRTIGIGRAIASALREAKRHGILHRDLKPDNVMLPRGGGLKVVDFGLAKRLPVESDGTLGPDAPSLLSPFELTSTDMGGLRGSPHYMAPEQWAAEPVTAAVDVWALGLILYEMLAGASPFRGATMSELCVQICGPSRIPALDRELPDDLAAIIDHCLHKQPADRPAIEDVHERLRQLVTDIS
jgi:serine/threonine protein kinase